MYRAFKRGYFLFLSFLLVGPLSLMSAPRVGATLPITFYANYGGAFYRSTSAFNLRQTNFSLVETPNFDGSLNITIANSTDSYYDLGFGYTLGALKNIESLNISGMGHFALNLWFDADHDGQFFVWSNNKLTGLGSDTYGLGPGSTNLASITNSTSFFMITACGGLNNFTLKQLKDGACTGIGINATTNVGLWVGTTSGPGSTHQVTISSINGTTPMQVIRTITFQTNPALGTLSIRLGSTNFTNGQNANLPDGNYSVTAIMPSGFTFTSWSSTGGIALANRFSNPTNITVTGTGTLAANFVKTPPPPPPALSDFPDGIAVLLSVVLLTPLLRKRRILE